MNIVIWIVTIVLACVFLGGGSVKTFASRAKQKEMGLDYVDDFPESTIRIIGILELLAVTGLIVPQLVDIGTVFVPLAATGLALTMVGAIWVHYRRGEHNEIPKNILLLVAAAFVAITRFGSYSL